MIERSPKKLPLNRRNEMNEETKTYRPDDDIDALTYWEDEED